MTLALLKQVMTIAEEAGDRVLSIYNAAADPADNTGGATLQYPVQNHPGQPAPIAVTLKADKTPLTAADLAAHQHICSSLKRLTPEIPVLSEESDPVDYAQRRQWQRYWLVDPLDGTKEFIHRNGEFTVNIALIEHNRPLLGAVHVPVSGSTFGGHCRIGALKRERNGKEKRIQARSLNPFRTISVLTSRSHTGPGLQALLDQIQVIAPVTPTPVGSSLKFCLIAEGLADLHLRDGPTSEWDTAAGQAVLEAAGGRITDLSFAPLRYNRKSDLINPPLLAVGDEHFPWEEKLGQLTCP